MTGDDLIEAFVRIRLARNRVLTQRDGLLCERHETGELVELDTTDMPVFSEPCWKAARKRTEPTPYSDGDRLYIDPPPSQWCQSCQQREALTDQYRVLVRQHAGALRGLIRRGKTLIAPELASTETEKPRTLDEASSQSSTGAPKEGL